MQKKLDAFKNWLIDKLGGYTVEEVQGRIAWRDRRLIELRNYGWECERQLAKMRDKITELAEMQEKITELTRGMRRV